MYFKNKVMKASELRIGNLVEKYLEPQISEWIETTVTIQTFIEIGINPDRHGYRPIPLTEEWLVKLGFKQMYFLGAKINYYVKGSIIYSIIDRHVEYKNGNINFIIRKCEHVHDLQNLYHAITGQELTLKTK